MPWYHEIIFVDIWEEQRSVIFGALSFLVVGHMTSVGGATGCIIMTLGMKKSGSESLGELHEGHVANK